MRVKVNKLLLFYYLLFSLSSTHAQFVDITQTEPFANPTSVCAGGVLTFRLNNLQSLNSGSIITMELSNSSGGFPGTILTTIEYSFNNITWTTGNYIWTSNVSNSYIRVNIPVTAIPGNGYTARAVSSSPNVSGGNNNGSITITAPIVTIPNVAPNSNGTNQWYGHVYSWTPTSGSQLNTPALVAAQTFFSTTNYKGHVVKNNLSFDDNFGSSGFLGSSNFYNQTSISCGNNLSNNFSIRYMRTENFAPGRYSLSIQADDGMRLSIDGGVTWLLNSFIEQQYSQSLQTTNTLNPTGICLSGNVNLVVEYFQRPAQARATVTITQLVSTINTPVNQNICAGQNASFDATCSEAGATYQWQYFDATNLVWINVQNTPPYSGANAPILNINNVSSNLNGTQYQCLVTNSCPNPIPSSTATLNVSGGNSSFTVQPIDATICVNGNTTFQAIFSGTNPSYQWLYSIDGGVTFSNVTNGITFSSVTSSTLNLNNIPSSFSGYLFYCLSIGSCGNNVYSDTVSLTVGGANPIITTQPFPINSSVCNGQSTQFTIGTAATSMFWQYSTDGGLTFQDISSIAGIAGTTSTTLTISPVNQSMNNWLFRCRLPGCNTDVFSNSVALQVTPSQTITGQPTIANPICIGANISLSVMANGATTYQWFITTQSVTTAIANNSIFSGANSNTLNISNIPIQLDGSQLYCSIGGACNITINSDTLTINLNINPTITQPTNQTECIGSNTNFTVSTTATNATYQWYLSTDNGINYNVVLNSGQYSGANSNSLSISNLTQLNDSTFFYCIITDACNASITTNSAILIIDDGVVGFGFQPTPKTVCEGQTVSFSCTSNNALTFQWQVGVNGVFSNLINNFNFSGCSTNILTINNASLNFNGNTYRCIISSCGSSINSIDASLTVKPKVVIVTQPNQIKLCLNEIAQLSLTAIGNGLTYQWQIKNTGGSFSNIALNNTLFYGINGPIIEVTANLTLQGKVIRCLVTDSCGAAISSEVSILITEPPRVNIQPKSESTCEGKNVYFTFDIYGDSLNYEWYFRTDSNSNFKKVTQSTLQYDSANSRILQVKNVMLENDGYQFYCTVASCNQPLRSDTVTLKVKNKVIPVFIPTCFTPNGDGLNEVLEFVGIKDTEIEGSIYNRWGQKIFDFSKYEPIWDGRYLNAKVQSGTYPYVITNAGKGCSGIITHGYIDVVR